MHSAILYFTSKAKRTRGIARLLPVKKKKKKLKLRCKILRKSQVTARLKCYLRQQSRELDSIMISNDQMIQIPSCDIRSRQPAQGVWASPPCLPRLHPHLLRVGHKQQAFPGTDPCETNAHRSHIVFPASAFPFVCCSGARQKGWRQCWQVSLGHITNSEILKNV